MAISCPKDVLDITEMMNMRDLPKALNMHKHKQGCAYKESIRVLVGSCELNYRRKLTGEEHVNCDIQPATPILDCTCKDIKSSNRTKSDK